MSSKLLSQCTVPGPNLLSRGIQHPFRLAIQRGFDRDQIAQFIGERGLVVERVFDRDGLALGVHVDHRDLPERIGDGLEIAFGVIAKRRRMIERIGDGGELCKVKQ